MYSWKKWSSCIVCRLKVGQTAQHETYIYVFVHMYIYICECPILLSYHTSRNYFLLCCIFSGLCVPYLSGSTYNYHLNLQPIKWSLLHTARLHVFAYSFVLLKHSYVCYWMFLINSFIFVCPPMDINVLTLNNSYLIRGYELRINKKTHLLLEYFVEMNIITLFPHTEWNLLKRVYTSLIVHNYRKNIFIMSVSHLKYEPLSLKVLYIENSFLFLPKHQSISF